MAAWRAKTKSTSWASTRRDSCGQCPPRVSQCLVTVFRHLFLVVIDMPACVSLNVDISIFSLLTTSHPAPGSRLENKHTCIYICKSHRASPLPPQGQGCRGWNPPLRDCELSRWRWFLSCRNPTCVPSRMGGASVVRKISES